MSAPAQTAEAPSSARQYEQYIDQQLARTTLHVKTVDVFSGLVLLALTLAVALLVLVLVDHWLVGLSVTARLVALIGLIATAVTLTVWRVLLPLVRRVNPAYAAQTVERAHPSMKNALVNFLFFRSNRGSVRPAVFQGVEQQAAQQLADAPIDSSVDHGPIIRWGYALVAVTAIWVAYILLSPKNPLQTLHRIAAPWQSIARPSQVEIRSVLPGNVQVIRGRAVEVQAEVIGLAEAARPRLVYSTTDGQLQDVKTDMQPSGPADANTFTATLTTDGTSVQQALRYHIEAGDATSEQYEVGCLEAPHIQVDRVEYNYPAYTNRPPEIMQGTGNVSAVEGTRVTIYARANQDIQRGAIELLPAQTATADNVSEASASDAASSQVKQAALRRHADDAQLGVAKLTMRLGDQRRESVYRAYRLRFSNKQQQTNTDPIEHTVTVTPDLKPVVQVLTPSQRQVDVPVNSWQKLEIRAFDPDYALTRVQLTAATHGRELFSHTFISQEYTGQFVGSYRFVPQAHGLQPGDVVEFYAVAEDNRHAPLSQQMQPTQSITARQYLRIGPASDTASSPPEDGPADDMNQEQGDTAQQDDSTAENPSQDSAGGDGEDSAAAEQTGEGDQSESGDEAGDAESGKQPDSESAADSQSDDAGENGGQSQQQNPDGGAEQSGSANQPNDGAPNQPNSGGADNSDPAANQPADNSDQTGEEGGTPDENSAEGDSDAAQPGMQQNGANSGDAEQTELGSGQASDSNTQQGSGQASGGNQETAADPNAANSGRSSEQSGSAGQPNSSDQQDGDGQGFDDGGVADQEALPSTGERDGEVVERIQKHMDKLKQQGKLQPRRSKGPEPDPDELETGSADPNDRHEGEKVRPEDRPANTDDVPTVDQSGAGGDGSDQPDQGNDSRQDDGNRAEGQDAGEPRDQASGQGTGGDQASDQPGNPDRPGDAETATGAEGTGDDTGNTADQPDSDATGKSRPDQSDGSSTGQPADSSSNEQPRGKRNGDSPLGDGPQNSRDATDMDAGQQPAQRREGNKPSPNQQQDPRMAGQGGRASDGHGSARDSATPAGGDDPNLEYARETTNLVLDYLRDQQANPDRELLDQLGWSKDDVQGFLRRWDQMQRRVKGQNADARQAKFELNQTLRSMGLRQASSRTQRAGKQQQIQRDNRNTGRQQRVPADLLGPFRSFQRSLQRAD